MKIVRVATLALAVVALGFGNLRADDGWSLWPFGGKKSTPPASKSPYGRSVPLSPTYSSTAKKKSSPTIFQRIGNGTKSTWNGATSWMTPKKSPKPKRAAPQKPGFFSGWFQPKEPQGPRTPTEWIGQPRVGE